MMTPGRERGRVLAAARAIAAVTFIVCCAGQSRADNAEPRHEKRNELREVERQWRSAELTGDAAAMDRVLAEDYVGTTLQGQVTTKSQQLRRLRDRTAPIEQLDLRGIKVRVQGEIAIVTLRAHVVVAGTHGAVSGVFRCRQVFHLADDGRWAMTNFEATPIHTAKGSYRTS